MPPNTGDLLNVVLVLLTLDSPESIIQKVHYLFFTPGHYYFDVCFQGIYPLPSFFIISSCFKGQSLLIHCSQMY